MSSILDEFKSLFEGKIDFKGQRLADRINQEGIILGAVVALVAGLVLDSLRATMHLYLVFSFLTFLFVVPPWGFYNRNQTKWLPNRPSNVVDGKEEEDEK